MRDSDATSATATARMARATGKLTAVTVARASAYWGR